ncbi:hypothetical protein VULLAG_LOCUS14082 [Vulpes lagopus]
MDSDTRTPRAGSGERTHLGTILAEITASRLTKQLSHADSLCKCACFGVSSPTTVLSSRCTLLAVPGHTCLSIPEVPQVSSQPAPAAVLCGTAMSSGQMSRSSSASSKSKESPVPAKPCS